MSATIHPLANVYGSQIGAGTKVAAFAEIGGAIVGKRCKVQAFAFLCPGVTIEDEVFIGPHVCFTNDRHPRAVGAWTREQTLVRRGASIGAGAVVLPGVTIGESAMVAAGVTVTADVPPGVVFTGRKQSCALQCRTRAALQWSSHCRIVVWTLVHMSSDPGKAMIYKQSRLGGLKGRTGHVD